jgi:hypothetical protein
MADVPAEELRPYPDTLTGAGLVDPEVAADAAAERVRELMVVVFAVEGAVGDDVIAAWSFGEKPLVLHASDLRELLESRDQLKAEVETLREQVAKLVQTIAAIPDAHRVANLAHARAQRDDLQLKLTVALETIARLTSGGEPS